MAKLLLIGAIPIVATIAIIFFLARPSVDGPKISDKVVEKLTGGSFADLTDENQITRAELVKILAASVSAVNARIDALAVKQGVSIPPPAPAPAVSSSGPNVAYIPLGSNGSSTSLNTYENISSTEITIDPANYPGYTKMYLEAQIRIFQGNGKGDGRFFDKTDGLGMSGSEVSTTSENFGLQSSSGFRIPSGKKTYVVQLKSTTGYSVDLQTTRIRVEF